MLLGAQPTHEHGQDIQNELTPLFIVKFMTKLPRTDKEQIYSF